MKIATFSQGNCKGEYSLSDDKNDIIIRGHIGEHVKNGEMFYIAASPPDLHASYTGSGLPFASPTQAFDGTPNKGTTQLSAGNLFEIVISYPNSYYAGLGTVLVPPTVYLYYNNGYAEKIITIKLSQGIPYRMLTYPMSETAPRQGPSFYDGMWELPVRTQEQILRDSAYPAQNHMHSNFWGLKPPV